MTANDIFYCKLQIPEFIDIMNQCSDIVNEQGGHIKEWRGCWTMYSIDDVGSAELLMQRDNDGFGYVHLIDRNYYYGFVVKDKVGFLNDLECKPSLARRASEMISNNYGYDELMDKLENTYGFEHNDAQRATINALDNNYADEVIHAFTNSYSDDRIIDFGFTIYELENKLYLIY